MAIIITASDVIYQDLIKNPNPKALSIYMLARRTELQKGAREIARNGDLGSTSTQYRQFERGNYRNPTIRVVLKIAKGLDVEPRRIAMMAIVGLQAGRAGK